MYFDNHLQFMLHMYSLNNAIAVMCYLSHTAQSMHVSLHCVLSSDLLMDVDGESVCALRPTQARHVGQGVLLQGGLGQRLSQGLSLLLLHLLLTVAVL